MTGVKWKLVQSNRYAKRMKKYRRNREVNKVLDERLKSLQAAADPRRLGEIKFRQMNGADEAYGTWLSKSVRLLFAVDDDAQEIRLLDMGSHKEVYGRD